MSAEGPDYTKIALLEHELLGIDPAPGSRAARILDERRWKAQIQASCEHEDVISYQPLGEVRARGICHRCGAGMLEAADGGWAPQ